jgi:acid phosphatase type 7
MYQIYQWVIYFFFVLSVPHLWADLASDTLYLTWQQAPTTTMTIQWISLTNEMATEVFYHKVENLEWKQVQGQVFNFPYSSNYLIHSIELTELTPATSYSFRINSQLETYTFHTMPAELTRSIQFVEGGDMYHNELSLMTCMCQEAAKQAPDFALLGGDLAYAVGSFLDKSQDIERWITWLKNWHATMVTPQGHLIPVLSAIGNHDLLGHFDQTPVQAAIFKHLFPSASYSIYRTVDFGSYLSLFLLDSGHAHPIAGKQTNWLRFSLENRLNTLHKLAIYHVPAYPAVRNFRNKQSLAIRRFWLPLFEEGGIQLAFEHHDHIYKRTHPLLKNKVHSQGIIYLGDGGWGVKNMRVPKQDHLRKVYLYKTASIRHFIHVTLTPTSQHFKVMTSQGDILDQFERLIKPQVLPSQN